MYHLQQTFSDPNTHFATKSFSFETLESHTVYLLFSKIGEDQSPEDAEDGPPELLVRWCVFVCLTAFYLFLAMCIMYMQQSCVMFYVCSRCICSEWTRSFTNYQVVLSTLLPTHQCFTQLLFGLVAWFLQCMCFPIALLHLATFINAMKC